MKTSPLTAPSRELEETIIQTAGEMAESLSINRLVGQIYALLYVSPEPVSLDEMVGKLKISKSSASVTIRILEDWNAVKKVLIPGSRKDYYTAEGDFFKDISERLEQGFTRRLGYASQKLDAVKTLALHQANGDKKLKNFYLGRLKQLEEIRGLLESALKFLPKMRSAGKLKMLRMLFD